MGYGQREEQTQKIKMKLFIKRSRGIDFFVKLKSETHTFSRRREKADNRRRKVKRKRIGEDGDRGRDK